MTFEGLLGGARRQRGMVEGPQIESETGLAPH